jgi:4-amino-4-deoxy-L-arabinose transferase-like glycosyltransferase
VTAPAVTSAEVAEYTITLPHSLATSLRPTAPVSLTVLPDAEPDVPRARPRRLARLAAVAVPRVPLLAILLVLSVMSARLLMSNTAFLDEATYLSAGHDTWHNWLHGGPDMKYSSYFSGSPVIYPLLGAAMNVIGGLAAARMLSLVFVLVTVALLYATTRIIFDRRAATWAAAIFATVEGTQFLAVLATYDAMALMLVALAVWLVVRYAYSDRVFPHAALLVGAPVLALANATKYATALYDPVVIAIVGLVIAGRYGWRQGARCTVLFTAMLGAGLLAALALAGHNYEAGLLQTTLRRADGVVSVSFILGESVRWVGAVAGVALVAAAVAWRRAPLVTRRGSAGSGRTRRVATAALLTVLAGAAVLAPLQQARIHTSVSLAKHVAFGAWFAAIACGWLLAQIAGKRRRAAWRWLPAVVLVGALAVIGHGQAVGDYGRWPNTTQLMASLRPFVAATDKPILMDDSDVASYYLGADLSPTRWSDTYFYAYTPPGSTANLTGIPAYQSAIAHNHFGVVALDFGLTADTDYAVKSAIEANPNYHYIGRVADHDNYGVHAFSVWINLSPDKSS